jgi:hypothetical protein
MSRSAEQAKQVSARPVDISVIGSGVMERDHLPKRGAELLAGRGIFVVQLGRIFAPFRGDVPDRETVAEPQPQELHPANCRRAGLLSRSLLNGRGLS